jgi:hypothetical protein
MPGGNYRGGGIWLRYTDGTRTFSPVEEADMHPGRFVASPAGLHFPDDIDGVIYISPVIEADLITTDAYRSESCWQTRPRDLRGCRQASASLLRSGVRGPAPAAGVGRPAQAP